MYRHMLSLHKVLCTAVDEGYIPAHPRADTMGADIDKPLQLSFAMADQLMYAFKRKPILASFESVGYLHTRAVQITADRQVGGAAPVQPRDVTSTLDMSAPSTLATPTVSQPPLKLPRTDGTFTHSCRRNPASKRLRPSSSTYVV